MALTHTTHDPTDGGEPIITLGERLAIARNRNHYKQEELAALVGVSTKTINRWEHDHNEPSPSKCLELARSLGISREWLLGDRPLRSRCFATLEGGSVSTPRLTGHLRPVD
jgi:transcriptional regulator with XRE-family HTH domain